VVSLQPVGGEPERLCRESLQPVGASEGPPESTSATLARERYPLWLRALDRVARLGRPTLSEGALLRVARRRSGLEDADLEPVRAPLEALLADFAEHPLSELGRVAVFEALALALENRLRTTAQLAAHPELRARPLPRPLVIVGLHRSGTTLLQNLLALGPGRRAPAFWELLRPAPAPGRRTAARRALWLSRLLAPEMRAIHPVTLDGPEECWTLLGNSLHVVSYALHFALPRYAAWLAADDGRQAYRELALQLRLVEQAQPPQPLVLKCPEHLWRLDALLAAFPDAGVVWTHRDPQRCVPSYASLSATNLRTLSGRVRRADVGPRITRGLAEGVDRALAARARLDPARFVDVSYAELVRDPQGAVARICAAFEHPFGDAHREGIARWLERHPAPRHRCPPATFGVDPEAVDAAFAGYRTWLAERGL